MEVKLKIQNIKFKLGEERGVLPGVSDSENVIGQQFGGLCVAERPLILKY